MYDWGRDREMQIENFTKLETPYFTVEKICVDSEYKDIVKEDFQSYTVISGSGNIVSENETILLEKEETIYIPHGVEYTINGNIELLKSYAGQDIKEEKGLILAKA